MYQLSISLVNQVFKEGRARLNSFIRDTYTLKIVKKHQNLFPELLNYKKELPNII